jgi:hypothetical protein
MQDHKMEQQQQQAAIAAAGAGEDRAAAEDGQLQERVKCLYGGKELRREVIATAEMGINAVGAKSYAHRRVSGLSNGIGHKMV